MVGVAEGIVGAGNRVAVGVSVNGELVAGKDALAPEGLAAVPTLVGVAAGEAQPLSMRIDNNKTFFAPGENDFTQIPLPSKTNLNARC